jgi:hypothetical protein
MNVRVDKVETWSEYLRLSAAVLFFGFFLVPLAYVLSKVMTMNRYSLKPVGMGASFLLWVWFVLHVSFNPLLVIGFSIVMMQCWVAWFI